MHLSLLRHRYDPGLNAYIREKTGYEIDIFEEFKRDVQPILLKAQIDQNDVYPIEHYLKAYGAVPEEQAEVLRLQILLHNYEKQCEEWKSKGEVTTEKWYGIVQGNTEKILSEAEYLEMQKEHLLQEELALNGLYKLSVESYGKGKQASTFVNISLPAGTGMIYTALGEKSLLRSAGKMITTSLWKPKTHFKIFSNVSG